MTSARMFAMMVAVLAQVAAAASQEKPKLPAAKPAPPSATSAPAPTVPAAAAPAVPTTGPATSATRIANGTRFSQWAVSCEALAVGETACVLSQRLVRKSDTAFLAEILAFRTRDGAKTFLAARVPVGAHFPSGFVIKPDKGEERFALAWQSCTRELCEALTEIPGDKLAEIEKGATATAGYRPSLRAEPMVFKIAFEGLGQGLDALTPRAGGAK